MMPLSSLVWNSSDVPLPFILAVRPQCQLEQAFLQVHHEWRQYYMINYNAFWKACFVDIAKCCNFVPQGSEDIPNVCKTYYETKKCLFSQTAKKCLLEELKCSRMRTEAEFWVSKLPFASRRFLLGIKAFVAAPEILEELYTSVNRSPARRYFLIIAFTMIGFIIIAGMSCGRVSRRAMLMKNK